MDLSEHDATFDLNDLEVPGGLRGLTTHPAAFGLGVGLVNGALAAVRRKKITVRGAIATAVVLALGETILALDDPLPTRGGRPPAWIGALSGVGVMAGLAFFTDWDQWAGGDHPVLLVQDVPPPRVGSHESLVA